MQMVFFKRVQNGRMLHFDSSHTSSNFYKLKNVPFKVSILTQSHNHKIKTIIKQTKTQKAKNGKENS